MKELSKLSPELEGNISSLEQMVFVVTNQESREAVIAVTRKAKSIKAQVIELFREAKDYANKAHKKICDLEGLGTKRCDIVEKNGKDAVTKWDDEQAVIREKERARLQAIEDEKARKEKERLLKRAASLKSLERSSAAFDEAQTIIAPVVQVAEKEKVKGESTRKVWKGRVTDPDKVHRIFMIIDQRAIDNYAKATKGAIPQEGIEFYEESSLAIKI